jgi:hypothetical protein
MYVMRGNTRLDATDKKQAAGSSAFAEAGITAPGKCIGNTGLIVNITNGHHNVDDRFCWHSRNSRTPYVLKTRIGKSAYGLQAFLFIGVLTTVLFCPGKYCHQRVTKTQGHRVILPPRQPGQLQQFMLNAFVSIDGFINQQGGAPLGYPQLVDRK